MDEGRFIESALSDPTVPWDGTSLSELARIQVPDNILGRKRSLLRADINEQWATWFIEGLVDPRRYAEKEISYPFLFSDVLRAVDQRFQGSTKPERQKLASIAARALQHLIRTLQVRRRQSISKSERAFLLDLAGNPPRCWVCGASFGDEAIDNFLYEGHRDIPLPQFVDVLKPCGLMQRDLTIEIDHVVPHARGGENESNLQLACGWCNRHKGALVSIYDVEGRPRRAGTNKLSIHSLPHPFWVVRLLAVSRRCEHPDGCTRSADNADMTIDPVEDGGAMNPANLRVTCYEHDPLRVRRLQPHRVIREIWSSGLRTVEA